MLRSLYKIRTSVAFLEKYLVRRKKRANPWRRSGHIGRAFNTGHASWEGRMGGGGGTEAR